jgi:hypothetical protein
VRDANAVIHRVRILPSALLIGVALHQIFLVETQGLSPWSGGGFGMFSSVDAGSTRHLHAFQIRPGIHREVRPPESLDDEVRRMLTLPSPQRMRDVAIALAEVSTRDHGAPASILIQVWHTRYDPDTLVPTGDILREFEMPLDHD